MPLPPRRACAASRTARPAVARLQSLLTHTIFIDSVLGRSVWVESHTPRFAISFSVASSSIWPCSTHFTPASIARRTARTV